jgi:pyrimidine operon attenuation protein/uracil phosphoribosyltransferase
VTAGRAIGDARVVGEALRAIAGALLAHPAGPDRLAVVGIRRRGDVLARRLAAELATRGHRVPVGTLDITFYRDDLHRIGPHPVAKGTEVDFDLDDRRVILVDDVLHTGRTVRAALDLLADLGRPARVELAVLVDRGGREVPIHADYVGRTVEVGPGSEVTVQVAEIDGADAIVVQAVGDGA